MTTEIRYTAPFEPLGWQVDPWLNKDRIMVLAGSAGGGKSRIAAEKIHGFCKKYPNATAICLRKMREFASKSVVYALERAIGDDPEVTYKQQQLTYHYSNGSKIFIAGLKDRKQREAIRSINGDGSADIIWAEEANAFTHEDHNELLARLRGKAASWRQILYTTNPDHPKHWIKTRLIDGGEATVFYSSAADNPHNPDDYADTLAGLTGVLGLRLRDGMWAQAEGTVYEYRTDTHLVDALPPDITTRFRAIDFGTTNPFVCQWWAVDHDGRMYMYREIYMTGRTVTEHARLINELSDGERISYTVCDHDAGDRLTLTQNKIPNVKAEKAITAGIGRVRDRLKLQVDGKPRIFFLRDALAELDDTLGLTPNSTIEEFPVYVYPKGADGKPNKEVPTDLHNHGMDAMRYAVMSQDGKHKSGSAVTAQLSDFF